MGLELGYLTTITTSQFLTAELKLLKQRWKRILKRLEKVKSPESISRKKSIITKTLEQKYTLDTNYIGIDSEESAIYTYKVVNGIKRLEKLIMEYAKDKTQLIREYAIDLVLSKFILPKVNISNGGYIIIEKTEALTTIDVNSGSFIKSNNARATSFWTNYMAVLEIVNQIKIRNIGGIIIIDFIDSTTQEDQIQILTHLSYKLKYEIIPTKIIQMSELGLVELTRARQGQNIYDALSKKCTTCEGLGYKSKFNTSEVKENFELLAQLIPVLSNAINK